MIHLCLTGFLLPGEFDAEGQCISIQLYTRDEKVYSLTALTSRTLNLFCAKPFASRVGARYRGEATTSYDQSEIANGLTN